VLLTFFDFPAEHWKHLRTSNVIESPFGTDGAVATTLRAEDGGIHVEGGEREHPSGEGDDQA
jgi:hypothetical protein